MAKLKSELKDQSPNTLIVENIKIVDENHVLIYDIIPEDLKTDHQIEYFHFDK